MDSKGGWSVLEGSPEMLLLWGLAPYASKLSGYLGT